MKLSILVPTVPSRIDFFYPRIMKELLKQIKPYSDIELISLFDNKKRSIGKKRQEMMNLAQGEYLVFIDDDDRISDDYVSQIMTALYNNKDTDCVVFDVICKINDQKEKSCKYGIEFEYGDINQSEWRGKPAHIMVYKSAIAKKHIWSDMRWAEDMDWVKRACLDIKIQARIDKVLYFYDAEYTTTSETAKLSDDVIEKNIKLLIERNK